MSKTANRAQKPRRAPRIERKLDLAKTREVLEQIEIAHRLRQSLPQTAAVQSRLTATVEHLLNHLPARGMALPVPSDQLVAPAVLELSGPAWVSRFPGSNKPSDCVEPFQTRLMTFLAALSKAGATVNISATFRPPERAYLMHYAWMIAENLVVPQNVPAMVGVAIDWVHRDASNQPDIPASRSAAMQMVSAYGIVAAPALQSRHTEGNAVDMDITWRSSLTIDDHLGNTKTITTVPRTGQKPDLQNIGAGYGVIKAVFSGDPPHWSADGH